MCSGTDFGGRSSKKGVADGKGGITKKREISYPIERGKGDVLVTQAQDRTVRHRYPGVKADEGGKRKLGKGRILF